MSEATVQADRSQPVLVRRPSLLQRSISYIGVSIQKFSSEICGHQQQSVDLDDYITKVRDQLTNEFNTNAEKYDISDVQLILHREEYRYVERFLEKQKNSVDDTVKMIKDTLRWRKDEGLSQLTDTSFPGIAYKCGFQFLYGEDVDGNICLHARLRMYYKYHSNFVRMMEHFFVHLAYKADQIGAKRGTGWILVADFSSVSVKQWDLPHFLWLLRVYQNHCPAGLRKIIVLNLAWFLRPVLKTVLPVIPSSIASLMHIANGEELYQHIAPSNLPKYLGGTNQLDPKREPYDDLPSIYSYMSEKYAMSSKEVKKVMDKYEKVIYIE